MLPNRKIARGKSGRNESRLIGVIHKQSSCGILPHHGEEREKSGKMPLLLSNRG
jgi:hypothetical protein